MADIILTTLNAKFIHASLGLRYLLVNMGELKPKTKLIEFTINQPILEIVEALNKDSPLIIGFGIYIWNVEETLAVIRALKLIRPEVKVVLGGPEVSHETLRQEIVSVCDHVICGEGDFAFRQLCEQILSKTIQPKVIQAPLPDINLINLPYAEFTDEDLKHRLVYVEASRGCPYKCEFCLSSLDEKVRTFPQDTFIQSMDSLLARGAKHFKFVDRTFNLDLKRSQAILEFALSKASAGIFFHFELVPDRLPSSLRDIIKQFPAGALQFEVGIQTLNPAIESRISRRQDQNKMEDNLRFLTQETKAHVHADLIVGLPGENLNSFATGFNRLAKLNPHEIQIGILKRLNGTPIARHTSEFKMVYSAQPPYEILQNSELTFADIQFMKRFARIFDSVFNSGHFTQVKEKLFAENENAFDEVSQMTHFFESKNSAGSGVALTRMFKLIFEYLVEQKKWSKELAADILYSDYVRAGKSDKPNWLASIPDSQLAKETAQSNLAKRQHRALELGAASSGRVAEGNTANRALDVSQ
jgi:radical SAM superfamily enzyme YgiQ (UPF0313 family)